MKGRQVKQEIILWIWTSFWDMQLPEAPSDYFPSAFCLPRAVNFFSLHWKLVERAHSTCWASSFCCGTLCPLDSILLSLSVPGAIDSFDKRQKRSCFLPLHTLQSLQRLISRITSPSFQALYHTFVNSRQPHCVQRMRKFSAIAWHQSPCILVRENPSKHFEDTTKEKASLPKLQHVTRRQLWVQEL